MSKQRIHGSWFLLNAFSATLVCLCLYPPTSFYSSQSSISWVSRDEITLISSGGILCVTIHIHKGFWSTYFCCLFIFSCSQILDTILKVSTCRLGLVFGFWTWSLILCHVMFVFVFKLRPHFLLSIINSLGFKIYI